MPLLVAHRIPDGLRVQRFYLEPEPNSVENRRGKEEMCKLIYAFACIAFLILKTRMIAVGSIPYFTLKLACEVVHLSLSRL